MYQKKTIQIEVTVFTKVKHAWWQNLCSFTFFLLLAGLLGIILIFHFSLKFFYPTMCVVTNNQTKFLKMVFSKNIVKPISLLYHAPSKSSLIKHQSIYICLGLNQIFLYSLKKKIENDKPEFCLALMYFLIMLK